VTAITEIKTTMKHVISYWKSVVGAGVLLAVVVLASAGPAEVKNAKPKPYPLKTCIVSGEKFGGDMGKPYVFVHEGQEIKLCCQGCLADFKKDPAKYIKKLAEAQKAGKDSQPNVPADNQSGHPH
jgi:hypothetical protein